MAKRRAGWGKGKVDYTRKGNGACRVRHTESKKKTTRVLDGEDTEFDICANCNTVYLDVTAFYPVAL